MKKTRIKKYINKIKWTLYVKQEVFVIAKTFRNISLFFRLAADYYIGSNQFYEDVKKFGKTNKGED